MNFKEIEKKYRPIPFWSWNSKLDTDETRRQIKIMDEAGMGGYFMHARGGLTTEYMGEEWFSNVNAGIEEGNKREMQPWAYDENGWPSGFGNGLVNGLGEEYQQKYLRWDKDITNTERTILIYWLYQRKDTPISGWFIAAFVVAYLICSVFTYKGVIDLIPTMAAMLFAVSVVQSKSWIYRIIILANSLLWILYDLIISAPIPMLVTHCIAFISVIVGIVRLDVMKWKRNTSIYKKILN